MDIRNEDYVIGDGVFPSLIGGGDGRAVLAGEQNFFTKTKKSSVLTPSHLKQIQSDLDVLVS